MAFLIVNKDLNKDRKGSGMYVFGLKVEEHSREYNIFQHPVEQGKSIVDCITEEPKTFNATLFVPDNPQSYTEQFEYWGKVLSGQDVVNFSEIVFATLESLKGYILDLEQSSVGTVHTLTLKSLSCSRDSIRKGMQINLELVEVRFAKTQIEEEWFAAEEVKATIKPTENKGNAPTEEVHEAEKQRKSMIYKAFFK